MSKAEGCRLLEYLQVKIASHTTGIEDLCDRATGWQKVAGFHSSHEFFVREVEPLFDSPCGLHCAKCDFVPSSATY